MKDLQMKRALRSVLIVLLLCVAGMTKAYAVTIGDLRYDLNENTLTATVRAHVNGTTATGNLIIPSSVTYGGQTYSVTSIGVNAFSGCSGFSGSLSIPNSVTTISNSAFSGCSGFTGSLIIPNSVTTIGAATFYGCSGFTGSLTIGNSVTSIGVNAFSGCSGLTGSLTIPNSVTSIGGYAFYGCSGFTGNLTIPNSVTEINDYAFSGCSGFTGNLSIPNSVSSIGSYAFYDCSGFTGSLTIPNSVTSIGSYAFYDCNGFTGSLTIPNSVIAIGNQAFNGCAYNGLYINMISIPFNAFQGCSGFTGSLTIGNSVTTISNSAFSGCSGFTGSLTIPNSVTSIGNSAFLGCSGFTGSLTIGNSVMEVGVSAFRDCSGFTGSLTIPNSVTTIGNSAFSSCSGFTGSLTIPNSVTTIGLGAFSGCSGFTGSLTIPNSVTSIGNSAFYNCSFNGLNIDMVNIPSGSSSKGWIEYIGGNFAGSLTIGNSVITIGNYAFKGCSGFTGSLTLPNTITSIGDHAFSGCSGLASLTIPNSVTEIGYYAFKDCFGLMGSLIIPNSVTTINEGAFYGCTGFTGSLTIGNSVTTIGNKVFLGCSGLTSLFLPNSVTSIGDYAFYGCSGLSSLTIPNSVSTIGMYAFSGCSGFTGNLSIPNSVTSIGGSAFYDCSGFTGSLIIPNSVTSIGGYAFSNCTGFTGSLTIPNSVSTIGMYAFSGCSGFTGNLSIPNSVTSIGNYAFRNCSGFTGSLIIPNSVTSIGSNAFNNCSGFGEVHFNATNCADADYPYPFQGCSGTLYIGDNVERIPNNMFSDAVFTGNLIIPNSVTSIGSAAFQSCGFIGSLIIPNTITEIEDFTFNICSSFTSLEIPETVTSIGYRAFACWYGLQSMTVLADNPPTLNHPVYAFINVNKYIPVYVPIGSIPAYQAAQGWNEFTNYHEYVPTSYTIAASANPAEGGAVTGGGTYTQGTICNLVATANEGYNFVNWTENGNVVSTNTNYSFTVSGNRNLVAHFDSDGNHWTPNGSAYSEIMAMYSVIQIDGVEQYSNTLEVGVFCGDECRGSAIASEFELTHRYLAVLNVFGENGHQLTFKLFDHSIGQELNLTSPATVIFDVNGYGNPIEPYVLNFTSTVTHTQPLAFGWNWWSTYIEQNGIDGLGMLENSIGTAGVRIQGRNGTIDQFEYQGTSYWYGSLNAIANEQMYKIRTNAACNAVIVGNEALPANHPITINNGWNWIGFPCGQSLSVNVAMSGFTPETNDVIKGRNGSTTYVSYGSTSLWYGTLNTLEPGQGYMYKSNSSSSKTLTFQTGRGGETIANVTNENSFFTPDVADFSDNMLVTAVIEMEDQELRSEDYELAAYVGNECRGSVRLMYVEPFDRYVAFLLVFGEAEEDIHFVLTDGNDMTWSDDLLTYAADGMEGTLTEPATLHFGALGLNDNERDFINVFPNPSNGVYNIEGNGLRKIEVVNAFGQTILLREVENNLMQIDLGDKAAGVYLLRVITNDGITTKQLIKE